MSVRNHASNALIFSANQVSRRREYPNLPHLAGPIAFYVYVQRLEPGCVRSIQTCDLQCVTATAACAADFFSPSTGPPHAGSIRNVLHAECYFSKEWFSLEMLTIRRVPQTNLQLFVALQTVSSPADI